MFYLYIYIFLYIMLLSIFSTFFYSDLVFLFGFFIFLCLCLIRISNNSFGCFVELFIMFNIFLFVQLNIYIDYLLFCEELNISLFNNNWIFNDYIVLARVIIVITSILFSILFINSFNISLFFLLKNFLFYYIVLYIVLFYYYHQTIFFWYIWL